MKRNNWIRLLAAALCLLLPVTALAAETPGRLRIVDIDSPLALYRVADAEGVLTAEFADAGVEDITDSVQAVANARKLAAYGAQQGVPGWEQTPDETGTVCYDNLEEGLYLIRSLAEEEEFKPFLVPIPTVINGEKIYHIDADPKAEETEPTEPTEPTESEPSEPTEPEETTVPTEPEPTDPGPNIPQTGNSVIPKYLLLAFGSLAVLLGLIDLIRGRRRQA